MAQGVTAVEWRDWEEIENGPEEICLEENLEKESRPHQHPDESCRADDETRDRTGDADDELLPRLRAALIDRDAAHAKKDYAAGAESERADRAGVSELMNEDADDEHGCPHQRARPSPLLLIVEDEESDENEEAGIDIDGGAAESGDAKGHARGI